MVLVLFFFFYPFFSHRLPKVQPILQTSLTPGPTPKVSDFRPIRAARAGLLGVHRKTRRVPSAGLYCLMYGASKALSEAFRRLTRLHLPAPPGLSTGRLGPPSPPYFMAARRNSYCAARQRIFVT